MFDETALQQLYRYAYSLTCDDNDAYDLLYGMLEKFIRMNVNVEYPAAYMKKMMYHRYIDDCRHNSNVQYEAFAEESVTADIDVQTLENIFVNEDMAAQIMQSLSVVEREILYCWAVEGFSTSEIAVRLDMPKGTVLSKIYRMRKKLVETFSDVSADVVEEQS